jgi:hypothetical protein
VKQVNVNHLLNLEAKRFQLVVVNGKRCVVVDAEKNHFLAVVLPSQNSMFVNDNGAVRWSPSRLRCSKYLSENDGQQNPMGLHITSPPFASVRMPKEILGGRGSCRAKTITHGEYWRALLVHCQKKKKKKFSAYLFRYSLAFW